MLYVKTKLTVCKKKEKICIIEYLLQVSFILLFIMPYWVVKSIIIINVVSQI